MTEPSLEEGYPDPEVEGVDESFEIISNKEKYLRVELEKTEKNLIQAESNVLIATAIKKVYEEEIAKEAKKNAH